jgi:tetratricopeptide (TPR) repeat protein
VLFVLPVLLAAAIAQHPQTLSLLEEPLYAPPLARAERTRLEEEVAQARGAVAREPANAEFALRLARAQRELGSIGDALETLTRAIEGKADSPALRLERGRDFVVFRRFDTAQREYRKAAETAPDAHCGIAFTLYLAGEYKPSHQEYGRCAEPGLFGYLAARRAGESAGPPPVPAADAAAGAAIRLPGSVSTREPREKAPMSADYMEAVERLLSGRTAEAKDLLKRIVEKKRSSWMEPVYVAAEADYARILKAEPAKKKRKRKG